MAQAVPQHRGAATQAPRAPHRGLYQKVRFVQRGQMSLQTGGFSLIRGQSRPTHRATTFSSRSSACFWGR